MKKSWTNDILNQQSISNDNKIQVHFQFHVKFLKNKKKEEEEEEIPFTTKLKFYSTSYYYRSHCAVNEEGLGSKLIINIKQRSECVNKLLFRFIDFQDNSN